MGRSLTQLDVGSWHETDEASPLGLPPALIRAVDDGKVVALLEGKLLTRGGLVSVKSEGRLSCGGQEISLSLSSRSLDRSN